MGSAQFNYKNQGVISDVSAGDWFKDLFLGTSQAQNKQNLEMLNYQNQFNEFMQDKANAFSEKMSNTAYQRAVKDMTQAGINPIVAFGGGASAASSPSSAMSSSSGASAGNLNFAGSVLGRSTAKIIDSGVNRMLRNTINNDEQLLKTLNVASKFI